MSNITLAPNAAGTATFTIAAPATSTNRTLTLPDAADTLATQSEVTAVAAAQLGVGQTWQDLTAFRAGSTSYQNNTGRPIMVSIRTSATLTPLQVSTNGSVWVDVSNAGSGQAGAVCAIVPNGHYYRFDGTTGIVSWAELR